MFDKTCTAIQKKNPKRIKKNLSNNLIGGKLIMLFFHCVKILQCNSLHKKYKSFVFYMTNKIYSSKNVDHTEEILLSIFSNTPLYIFSVRRTCLARRFLCFHHILWREVHNSKEFDERLTMEELLSVLSTLIHCVLHEDVEMKHIYVFGRNIIHSW